MAAEPYDLKKPPSAGENIEWKNRIYVTHKQITQRKCVAYFDVSGECERSYPRRGLPDLICTVV